MKKSNWRSTLAALLSLALLNAGFISSAHADVIDTATMVQTARGADLASIQGQLARDDVRAQLAKFGVDAGDIESRLAVMSDSELASLAKRMQETPAGGDGLLAVIGLTFVVLLILELVGVINIFNRA
ncbi:MAG TPA: PA2779 family protein [Steroidobacteraceae bacterium]|nr:PA2779 family protein [Steroidobacteraceae bacterium]